MMKHLVAALTLCVLPLVSQAQEAETGLGAELRILDKLNGSVSDVELSNGDFTQRGTLRITLDECRFPRANPSGDAFADITVTVQDGGEPIFAGWLIASAPALHAMEHPRYDVWVLRCIR